MNKIEKFLKKLNKKEQKVMLLLMLQIKKDYLKVPHLLKLKNKQNLYRVRIGRYRIVFEIKEKTIEIKKITKLDEQTYNNL